MAWQLTAGLANLRTQVNARWPGRDHASDGTIGDPTHQASVSSHNPDDTVGSRPAWSGDPDTTPEVRAWDMDSDLGEPGTTAQDVVDHIRALPGVANVIRYMIYNRRMYHVRNDFEPTAYDGPSAHTEHIHFEGGWTQAADNNTTFDYRLDEVGHMPLADDKIAISADTAKEIGKKAGDMVTAATLLQLVLIHAHRGAVDADTAVKAAEAVWQGLTKLDERVAKIENWFATLGTATAPEQTAALLRAVLGDRAAEIGRILTSGS